MIGGGVHAYTYETNAERGCTTLSHNDFSLHYFQIDHNDDSKDKHLF
jgi:hypothetical protein